MTELFLKILNMSISASWLVLLIIALRFLLKKAPKWINVLLWGLVAFRLVCPFTLESALSLIPSAETVSPEIMMDATPEIHTGIQAVNSVVNPVITETFAPDPAASANPLQILIPAASAVWCTGMALMLLYTLFSYWRLRRRVRMAIRVKENIYLSEYVSSPFVLGIFRPRIYLPYHMEEQDRRHVIAHERTHIQRKDHWWKPLGFLLLTIHWFNPLMWAAYILLCRDIELACDEKVVKHLGEAQRADYSQALLNCSIGRRSIAACPLAFGEVGVKERVKNVLHYKKPAFWVILLAILTCILVAVCFLTDPKSPVELENLTGKVYDVSEILYSDVRYSFTYVPEQNAPSYAISEEGHLLSQNELNSDGSWTDLGQLQPLDLTEDNFDHYFFNNYGFRTNMTAASLRRNNAQAWWLVYSGTNGDVLYNILRQENGDLYLACGYPEPDMELIRWVMELEAQPEALWDLTMTAHGISSTGLTLSFHQAYPTPGKFITGSDFTLETLTDGGWATNPFPADTVWTTIAYRAADGNRISLSWEHLCGALPEGTYRIAKTVENELTGESRVLYAEFTIGNSLSWLQTLTPEDVARIEFRDHHTGVDLSRMYTLYEGDSLKEAVETLNLFNGLPIDPVDPLDIVGGGFELTLTMKDGTTHTIYNVGNRYLRIDDTCYEDSYDVLNEEWNYFTGTTYLPANESNWGIRLGIQEINSSNALLVYHVSTLLENTYFVSSSYTLQTLENGEWKDMERIQPEAESTEQDIQSLLAQQILFGKEYGELPNGTYRIGKTFYTKSPYNTSPDIQQTLYAEFTLPGDSGCNLTITAEDLSNTEVVLYFHPVDPNADWYYLSPYRLEESINGVWTQMELLPEMRDATWSTLATPIPTDGGLCIPWEWYYGTLSPGTYRVALDVTQKQNYASEDVYTVYAEFTLPEGGIAPQSLETLLHGYSLEQAEIDGCLVMVDGDVRYHQQSWFDFVDLVQDGTPASMRIVEYYNPRENEPSHTFLYDVSYDGSRYTLRWGMVGDDSVQEESYQYLRSFTGQPESEYVDYDAYERFVLTNDNQASYEEMFSSLASSQLGAVIPHQVVYSDLIYFPDHPDIPETLSEATLVIPAAQDLTVKDPAALESLRTLLANAEFLGYYPKTPDFGPTLRLKDPSGAVTTLYLSLDSDMFELDGNCFDYGPGYDGYGTNNDIDLLWQILGLTEWAAPNVTKWPLEICNQYESYRETIAWAKEHPMQNRMFIPLSPDWDTDTFTITLADGTQAEITDAERDELWELLSYAPLDKYYGPTLDLSVPYTIAFTYNAWNFSCLIYPLGDDQFYFTRSLDTVLYTCTLPELTQAIEAAIS